jgi:hypothetical protein
MLYAFEQEVPIDSAIYEKIMQRMGAEPIAGQLVHLALQKDDGTLRYIDVWTSKEAYDRAVADRIHPAVSAVFREIGFRPTSEPLRQELNVVDVRGRSVGEVSP